MAASLLASWQAATVTAGAASTQRRCDMQGFLRKWLPLAFAAVLFLPSASYAQVAAGELRPFVVGLVPVIGSSGAVGGVSIDARGAVSSSSVETLGRLREARLRALTPI